MRIVFLAAGAAGNYCGACARDVALVRGLSGAGHDVLMVPLYTPLHTDGDDPSLDRVFLGGINCYLQQHLAAFRHAPRFVDWLLNRPALLRWASRLGVETEPEKLGAMTVSVLKGADGRQRKELAKLLDFLAQGDRPDVVNLTNSLLSGLAPAIKARLGSAVVCTLQGEDAFVARLGARHAAEAGAALRRNAEAVDLFIAPGESYADEMAVWLDVERQRIRVIRPGIDLTPYADAEPKREGMFRIGFLSRLDASKGLDVLCEAFVMLEQERPGAQALAVAGQESASGRRLWRALRARLSGADVLDRVDYVGQVDLAAKVSFLNRCHAFCLPTSQPGRVSAACLEALAAGVPIVVPNAGPFPEMVALTQGGLLLPEITPRAVAEALALLRDDPDARTRMGAAAASGVREHFSSGGMVAEALAAYTELDV